ncbi:hypothetical protein LEWO105114_05795 [Legionella worsleiensis]|uniref:Uncharacterized protein n=1 Tax=Legionella worsleiensis TaxID=45076 RepID=A0A0W1AGA7_9GAMM|nr:hypothetical protein Lwor_1025 [Legionella worsleiensis]STY32758.1 Uncharacterised protein [Legionella worsleiensis]
MDLLDRQNSCHFHKCSARILEVHFTIDKMHMDYLFIPGFLRRNRIKFLPSIET